MERTSPPRAGRSVSALSPPRPYPPVSTVPLGRAVRPAPRAEARPAPGVPRAFLDALHCPYCGSDLELTHASPPGENHVEYGLLRCACYEYPILDGIVLLQQRAPYFPGDLARATGYVKEGLYAQALRAALWLPPRRHNPLIRYLARVRVPGARRWIQHVRDQRFDQVLEDGSLTFREVADLIRAPFYAKYLFQRYANASFLAATLLNLMFHDTFGTSGATTDGGDGSGSSLAPGPRVLDICCGVGHNSFQVVDTLPNAELIACDCDFTNLYVARRFFIPGRICIGLDLEVPMPFPDDDFDAVLCSDAFVHMHSKQALLREVDRVVNKRGLWLFSHFHNALVDNPMQGLALTPEAYQRLFGFVEGRLMPEGDMLRSFVEHNALDFKTPPRDESLRQAHAFEWVGGHDSSRWCKRIENVAFPPIKPSSLGINPVFEVQEQGDRLVGRRMTYPPDFDVECGPYRECIPGEFAMDRSLLERLVTGRLAGDDEARVQELLHRFVLVQLPPRYGHRELRQIVTP